MRQASSEGFSLLSFVRGTVLLVYLRPPHALFSYLLGKQKGTLQKFCPLDASAAYLAYQADLEG